MKVKNTNKLDERIFNDEPPKIKIVGKRSGKIAPTLENATVLINTMRQLHGGRGICPRGVYTKSEALKAAFRRAETTLGLKDTIDVFEAFGRVDKASEE